MHIKSFITAVALLNYCIFANAASLKENATVCVTKDLFDQISSADAQGDQQGVSYLFHHGCVDVKAGLNISVLDYGGVFDEDSKIRIYTGNGDAFVVWTNREWITHYPN